MLGAIGVTAASFVPGTGSSDPTTGTNLALNLSGFPAQGTADRSAGVQFSVDTTGYSNLVLTFDQQNTPNASGLEAVQYSLNGGTTWTDAAILGYSTTNWNDGQSVNLSAIPGAANNPNLELRIVSAMTNQGTVGVSPVTPPGVSPVTPPGLSLVGVTPPSPTGLGYAGTTAPYDPTGAWNLDMVTVSGTAVPVVTVSGMDMLEGSSAGGFTFTRTGDLTNLLTATYTVSGTATPGTDYTPLTGVVSFNANENSAFLPITAFANNVVDGTKTVVATLSGGGNYLVDGSAGSATVNIADQPLTVSVERLSDATEGGAGGMFRFLRSGDLSSELTVNYTVSGTAVAGTNYTPLSGTVTIQPGSDHTDVPVTALPDGTANPTLTVTATLNTSSAFALGNDSDTVFIMDADTPKVYWTDGDHTGLWEDPLNWSTGAVPTPIQDVYFSGGGTPYSSQDSCTDLGASASGSSLTLAGLHLVNGYSGTVTVVVPLTVGTLEETTGILDQPATTLGSNISVTTALLWTGGTLNSTTNLANVTITGATTQALIAPGGGGTVYCGSNISIENGANTMMKAGTIEFTNNNIQFYIGALSNVIADPGTNQTVSLTDIYGPTVWLRSDGNMTLNSGGILNAGKMTNAGSFTIKAGTIASFRGVDGDGDAYRQTGGGTYIYGESMLATGLQKSVAIEGGTLATISDGPPGFGMGDCTVNISTQDLDVSGGDIYINFGASAHVSFGTLRVIGSVIWIGGTFHPFVEGNVNKGQADMWTARDTFTIGGTAALAPTAIDEEWIPCMPTSGFQWQLLWAGKGIGPANTFPTYDTGVWGITPQAVAGKPVTIWYLTAK
jgi:adhesin HecA-like repeat protein